MSQFARIFFSRSSRTVCLAALLLLLSGFGGPRASRDLTIGDFSLRNVDGRMVSLSDYSKARGLIVVFTCNHCPFAKLYPPRLNALTEKFGPLGVPLISISSTDPVTYEEDSYEKMVEKARNEGFRFPYLFDERQEVARMFKAQKTPHAFVLWKKNNCWTIRYSGAIDDNGAQPDQVKEPYVANAVEALLQDKEVAIKETRSIGCQIYFSK